VEESPQVGIVDHNAFNMNICHVKKSGEERSQNTCLPRWKDKEKNTVRVPVFFVAFQKLWGVL
jgi:hypothetical protein